jgi:mannose-6-phosphate isomerase-like protein (cupin superfamily)
MTPASGDVPLDGLEKIRLVAKFASFHDHFSPKVIAELNGQEVKMVKFRGSFIWHHHDVEDELFLVVAGRFRMDFRDHEVWLEAGEMIVVPHGVEHRPHADEEVSVLLFEPASTLNTGNVRDDRTVERPERL